MADGAAAMIMVIGRSDDFPGLRSATRTAAAAMIRNDVIHFFDVNEVNYYSGWKPITWMTNWLVVTVE